jgi:hypothetical protein
MERNRFANSEHSPIARLRDGWRRAIDLDLEDMAPTVLERISRGADGWLARAAGPTNGVVGDWAQIAAPRGTRPDKQLAIVIQPLQVSGDPTEFLILFWSSWIVFNEANKSAIWFLDLYSRAHQTHGLVDPAPFWSCQAAAPVRAEPAVELMVE